MPETKTKASAEDLLGDLGGGTSAKPEAKKPVGAKKSKAKKPAGAKKAKAKKAPVVKAPKESAPLPAGTDRPRRSRADLMQKPPVEGSASLKIADSRKLLDLPVQPGLKLFEAPDGFVMEGEEDKPHVWYRGGGDNGKGGWINPVRQSRKK